MKSKLPIQYRPSGANMTAPTRMNKHMETISSVDEKKRTLVQQTHPQSMIYFKARQQLLEKEQEILRLKQTMNNSNAVEISKNIKNTKLFQENLPCEKQIPISTRVSTFEKYSKVKNLQGLSESTLNRNLSDLKGKTKKLVRKIPESVLKSFHIPKYLRA